MTLPFTRPSEARRWLVAWVLFCAVGGLWALASPMFSVPDEPSHAVYAAAAVRGEIWAHAHGTITDVTVPADFARAGAMTCFARHPETPAGCAGAFGGHAGMTHATTTAGRYPPAYYLFAGLPTLVTTGAKAFYLMRLLTVALVAALLASATCSALRTRRPVLALTGLGFAVTPMVLFFAGAVNPQGPEIAAAVAVWVSGFVLLSDLRRDPSTPLTLANPLLRRTLVAMAALSLCRTVSLLWLALVVVALLAALITRTSARRLLTSRAVWAAVPVLALTCGSTLFWIVARHAAISEDITAYANSPLHGALIQSVGKLNDELFEMIGVFGWLDAAAPGIVYVAFLLGLGALGLVALVVSGRRTGIVLGLVALGVMVVPVVMELLTYRTDAFPWQGRYTLPLAVGVPLILGLSAATSPREPSLPRLRLVAAFGAVFVVVQFGAFLGTLNRYVKGEFGFFLLTPSGWAPPLPTSVLLGGMLVALLAMVVLAVRARPGTATAPTPHPALTPAPEADASADQQEREPVPVSGQS